MRLDLALFLLRLFKSRTLAARAVREGAVLLNGQPARAGHDLSPGDRVTVADPTPRTFEVLALPGRSLSRPQARDFLREV